MKEVGDKLTFGLRMLLTGQGVQGDGVLEGNEEQLVFYPDSITINQIRHAVRSQGRMSEQRVPYSVRDEARMGLSDWHADRLDTAFMNQLAGNTNQTNTLYTGNNSTTAPTTNNALFATSSAESSLSDTSICNFTLSLLDKAVVYAKTAVPRIRPLKVKGEEKYVAFIHPFQTYQLRTNTNTGQWLDIQKAAMQGGQISKNPIFTGAIGEYNSVVLHESTRVPWGIVSDTGQDPNSATMLANSNVARAVFAGAQAGVCCTGRKTKQSLDATWSEELFDYGNQLGVAGGLIYGIVKAVFNSTDFSTITMSTYSKKP